MKYAAAITAGGRVGGEFARTIGTTVKALAPIGGTTLLDRCIAALRGAGVERIALVGGAEVREAAARQVDRFIEESADGTENVHRALHAWEPDSPLLYATSDMPFVNGAAIRAFLARVPDGALAVPLAEWRAFDARFPGAPPFGIVLGGEKVVNGGVFAIPAAGAQRIAQFAARFFEARKSPWRMARLTGPALLLQFATHRLRVDTLEAHAARLLAMPAVTVRDAAPELAYDIDELAEYTYAIAQT